MTRLVLGGALVALIPIFTVLRGREDWSGSRKRMDGFPLELRYKPTPLVAVAGAPKDFIVAVEKATSAVTIETQRSCPIFRFLSTSPKELIIPPRNDKDKPLDYIPEGILPAGWITALSHKIPCAILYVVEWDAHDFKAREYEHFAALDSIRASAKVRNMPVLVMLLKKDAFAANDERLVPFKRKCQLDNRFFLNFVKDEFSVSMIQLEGALKRCALEFYVEESKLVKKKKEKLNKTAHLKLIVRASYKMAFYSELCNDFASAVKHYSAAYTQLRDVKKNWKDYDEIKVVAEILNFRLCYLHLERNTLSNATTQFHQHVNYYRSLIGDPDREFQHYAWVSRQFQIFGELLQLFSFMAPTPAAGQATSGRSRGWAHPGFYFQAAANFEALRRAAAMKLCSPQSSKENIIKYLPLLQPFKSSVMDFGKNSYVGQRVESTVLDTRTFNTDLDPTLLTSTLEAVLNNSADIAVAQELLVTHSTLIVKLLSLAQDSYRLDHTPNDRTLWQLTSQIAHEAFLVGDFVTTKTNNDLVIPHYRREKWWGLLATCLRANLQCAIQLKQWDEAVRIAAELLAPTMPSTSEDRKYFLSVLAKIVSAHRLDDPSKIDLSELTPTLALGTTSNPFGTSHDTRASTLSSSSGGLHASSSSLSSSSSTWGVAAASAQQAMVPLPPIHEVLLIEPVTILQSHAPTALIKCLVTFKDQSASIYDQVTLNVTLTSYFPQAMRFDALKIFFTDANLNAEIVDQSQELIARLLPEGTYDQNADFSQYHTLLTQKHLAELANNPTSLVLLPNKPKSFPIAVSFTHVSTIQCTGATLQWGTVARAVTFKWDWTLNAQNSSVSGAHLHHAAEHAPGSPAARRLIAQSSIEVLQLRPKLEFELDHFPVALQGEKLPITFRVINGEDAIKNGIIRITTKTYANRDSSSASTGGAPQNVAPSQPSPKGVPPLTNMPSSTSITYGTSGMHCPFVSKDGRTGTDTHEIPVPAISENSEFSVVAHFLAPKRVQDEAHHYKVQFIYDTLHYSTTAEQQLKIDVRSPFEVSFDVYDEEFREVPHGQVSLVVKKDASAEPMRLPSESPPPLWHSESSSQLTITAHTLAIGSQFFLRAELKSLYDLHLQNVELTSSHTDSLYQNLTQMSGRFMEPCTMQKGNKYSVWFALKAISPMSHSLGTLAVTWGRHDDQAEFSSWPIQAPFIYAESPPFSTSLKCSHVGTIYQPIEHETLITNHTGSVLCLALEIEESNGFALSGDKKAQYRLNAFAEMRVKHVIVPLAVGTQKCPKFLVKQLASDGSGLGQGGVMEAPYLTLAHADIFIEPDQSPPMLV